MIFSAKTTLLKYSSQLNLTSQLVGTLVLVSLVAGIVAGFFILNAPQVGWFILAPISVPIAILFNRITQLTLSDRLDGSYRTLRASGVTETGYLFASALLLTALLLSTGGVTAFGVLLVLSDRLGILRFIVGLTLAIPWFLWAFYALTYRIMHTADQQAAAATAQHGLGLLVWLVVLPGFLLFLFEPAIVVDLLTLLSNYWLWLFVISWSALLLWLVISSKHAR